LATVMRWGRFVSGSRMWRTPTASSCRAPRTGRVCSPARPRPRLPRAAHPPSPPAARLPGGQGRAQSLSWPPAARAVSHR
jgi:hypothetical protein